MGAHKFYCQNYPHTIGLRLDKALSYFEEIKTRSRAENLLEQNRVLVNGRPAKSSYKITGSEEIEINFPEEKINDWTPYPIKLDILFEDKDLIILNKPSGLVVHPGAGHQDKTLVHALIAHTDDLSMKFNENRPGIVHRIDKETSGLLVIAKNDFSHEALSQQFKNKTVHRIYQSVCWGQPRTAEGTIQSFLARHPMDRQRFASVRNSTSQIIREIKNAPAIGKWAVTHYEVQNSQGSLSLLKFKLDTGRTHQIRVHSSEMGHPILGDNTYGSLSRLKDLKNPQLKKELSELTRFFLHAAELGVIHPKTKERIFFKVDWPESELTMMTKWGLI